MTGITFAQNAVISPAGNAKSVTLETNSAIHSVYPLAILPCSEILPQAQTTTSDASSYNWKLYFTQSGKVFKDVSFANSQTGYIVTELGAVFKTTNGGINWTVKLNLGFPYYWYGVFAVSPDTVIISGFNNQGDIHSGLVRWSYNGGTTWTADINLYIPNGVGWLDKVHFYDQNTGIVFAGTSGAIHYTNNGGRDSASWNYVQVNSDLAWFAGNYDFQNSGNIYAAGIHLGKSSDYGLNWLTFPSADNVFDGGVDFLDNNNNYGWTGGGQISSPVSGWVHRTTDAGATWSQRLNTFPYPIRAVKFFNQNSGIICGGNVYSEAGGIYSTSDGGTNWNPDVNTLAEMFSINIVSVTQDSIDLWCVGSTGGATGFIGKAYKSRIGTPAVGVENISLDVPDGYILHQNFPNPFNPSTKISYSIPVTQFITLKIYDVLGNEVATLVNQKQNAGTYSVEWNAVNFTSGIYFYTLETPNYKNTKKMLVIK
jgi:photosystem II stability/assembly factor-like uncharacterized protein